MSKRYTAGQGNQNGDGFLPSIPLFGDSQPAQFRIVLISFLAAAIGLVGIGSVRALQAYRAVH